VREQIAIKWIEYGIVDVGSEHAFAQVIQHQNAHGATQPAKCFFVQLGPDVRTGTKDQEAHCLAAIAQGEDKQARAPILTTWLFQDHRTGPIINLGFLTRGRDDRRPGDGRFPRLEFVDETSDAVIAVVKAVLRH